MWTRRPFEGVRRLQTISGGLSPLSMSQQRITCSRLPRPQRRGLSSKPDGAKATEGEPASGKIEKRPTLKDRLQNIQAPGWVWTYGHHITYPIRAYNRAQNKRPYLVQLMSSLTIYVLGDLSSQLIERPPPAHSVEPAASKATTDDAEAPREFHYNPERSLRAFIIGGVFSMPSYHWFLFLSNHFNVPATVPRAAIWTLALKVVINQLTFGPFFNAYFFGMHSLLSSSPEPLTASGEPVRSKLSREYVEAKLEHAWHRITQTVPTAWWNSCKFWPFVTAFSFTFVRPQSRSVFAGLVAIGWQSYLGILNQRAERRKRRNSQQAA